MKIALKEGDRVISTPIPTDDVIVRPKKPAYETKGLVVGINDGDGVVVVSKTEKPAADEGKKVDIEVSTNIEGETKVFDSSYDHDTGVYTLKTDDGHKTVNIDVNDLVNPKNSETVGDVDKSSHNETKVDEKIPDGVEDEPANEDKTEEATETVETPAETDSAQKSDRQRDEKGRFISTGPKKPKKEKNKVSSTFIPSK